MRRGENISFRRHLATACLLSIALIAGVYAPASIADDAPPLPTPTETVEPETDIGNFLLAQIVKYRREHGPFEDFDALAKVPGLNLEKLEKKRDAISF